MKYRIASSPGRGTANPYIDLFYDALEPHNVSLVAEFFFIEEWLKNNIHSFDAIHFHWPEMTWRNCLVPWLVRVRSSGIKGTWRLSMIIEKQFQNYFDKKSIESFRRKLDYLKSKNKKIIWTWHNVEPHENVRTLDFFGNQILADYADLLIFHSDWAEQQCLENYNISCKTVVMQHGNYDGVYPAPRDRFIVAQELGLNSEKPVVGIIGNIREYKGIDVACEALLKIADRVQFLCAGNPYPGFDLEKLRLNIERISGALVPKIISDQEFSDYVNLCDFLLMPYKKVTGSGVLHAVLTLSRGVIASDLPYFREILNDNPDAGVLVKPCDEESLAAGIIKYLDIPKKVRSEAARALADKYGWNEAVIPVVLAFKELGLLMPAVGSTDGSDMRPVTLNFF
jgi:glycosyltransferase involved in cell wall biosynthesis